MRVFGSRGVRLLLLGGVLGLAACGKKGPLYLPTPTPAPAGAARAGPHPGPAAPVVSPSPPAH